MTRAQLRRFLRSKLGDMHPTNPIFTDSDLNLTLLMAGRVVQNWVNAVDPNPYCVTQVGDITANVATYSIPPDYRSPGVRLVELLSGSTWTVIGRQEFNDLDTEATRTIDSSTTAGKYAIGGRMIRLKIVPTVSVTGSLRMTYAALVVFADDDDNSVLQLPLELDPCIYEMGAYLLSGDIGEDKPETHYKAAKIVFDEWANGFKTTIGKDGEQINHVGGHIRTGWARD